MSDQAYADYAVPATPYFVMVDGPSGRVAGEGAAVNWRQLAGLAGRAAGDSALAARRRRHRARLRDTDAELVSRRHRARRPQPVAGEGPAVNVPALVAAGIAVAVVGAIRSAWSP